MIDMISQFQQISLTANEIFTDIMDTIKIQQTKIKFTKRRIDKLQTNMECIENKNASNPCNPSIFYDHPDRHDLLINNKFGHKPRRHLLKNGDLFNRSTTNEYLERRRNHETMSNAHIPLNKYFELRNEINQKRFTEKIKNRPTPRYGRDILDGALGRNSSDTPPPVINGKISDPDYFATEWKQEIDKTIQDHRFKMRHLKKRRRQRRRRHHWRPKRITIVRKRYDPVTGRVIPSNPVPPPVPILPANYPEAGPVSAHDTIRFANVGANMNDQKNAEDPYPYTRMEMGNRSQGMDRYYDYYRRKMVYNGFGGYSPAMFRPAARDKKRCELIDCERCYILRDIVKEWKVQNDTKFEMNMDDQMRMVDLLINGCCRSLDKNVPMDIVKLLIIFHGGCFKDDYYKNEWVFGCLYELFNVKYEDSDADSGCDYCRDSFCWCTDSD